MEEIDIIELLKRVKEGKAPKKIQISATRYESNGEPDELVDTDIEYLYLSEMDERPWIDDMQPEITIQTKIKILDKHKVEKLEEKIHGISLGDTNRTLLYVIKKINEIIEKINGKEI